MACAVPEPVVYWVRYPYIPSLHRRRSMSNWCVHAPDFVRSGAAYNVSYLLTSWWSGCGCLAGMCRCLLLGGVRTAMLDDNEWTRRVANRSCKNLENLRTTAQSCWGDLDVFPKYASEPPALPGSREDTLAVPPDTLEVPGGRHLGIAAPSACFEPWCLFENM